MPEDLYNVLKFLSKVSTMSVLSFVMDSELAVFDFADKTCLMEQSITTKAISAGGSVSNVATTNNYYPPPSEGSGSEQLFYMLGAFVFGCFLGTVLCPSRLDMTPPPPPPFNIFFLYRAQEQDQFVAQRHRV